MTDEHDQAAPAAQHGRCGAAVTAVFPGGHGSECALPLQHRGWHRSDEGTEWGQPAITGQSPPPADPAPPRLRTMTLPNGTWIFVLDRLSQHLVEPTVATDLSGFAAKTGAAATAVFAFEVDIEDAVVDEALQEAR